MDGPGGRPWMGYMDEGRERRREDGSEEEDYLIKQPRSLELVGAPPSGGPRGPLQHLNLSANI